MPASLRKEFGVSWFQAGQPDLPWREVHALVVACLRDQSTALGAECAGFDYPASWPEIYTLQTLVGPDSQVLPFDREKAGKPIEVVTDAEVAEALESLNESIVFASE